MATGPEPCQIQWLPRIRKINGVSGMEFRLHGSGRRTAQHCAGFRKPRSRPDRLNTTVKWRTFFRSRPEGLRQSRRRRWWGRRARRRGRTTMKTIKTFQLFHMNSQMFRSLALAAGVALAIGQDLIASDLKGLGFSTPEDAVTALQQALSAKDRDRLQAIFGPDLQDLVNPDSIQAANEFAMAATAINESHRLVNAGDGRMTLEYGNE